MCMQCDGPIHNYSRFHLALFASGDGDGFSIASAMP